MTHLLVVAHGSRQASSNAEIATLVAQLNLQNASFAGIDYCFLEIATPSIEQGLRQQIASGARAIIVMPYFLAAGRHVTQDLPEQVERIRAQHPAIPITIAPHLGASQHIPPLLLAQALTASADHGLT